MMDSDTPLAGNPQSPSDLLEGSDNNEKNGPWEIQVGSAEVVPSYRSVRAPLESITQIQAKLWDAYNSNLPFFTKDAIRQAGWTFDKIIAGSNTTVSITGLDGVPVEFRSRMGEPLDWHIDNDPDVEVIMKAPSLDYRSVEAMTWSQGYEAEEEFGFDRTTAYLPMLVQHETDRRNKHTKEIIHPSTPATHHELQSLFRALRRQWRTTESFLCIQSLFTGGQAGIPPLPPGNINKVIALSCSTMAFDNTLRPRSAAQHALALSIRDLLLLREGPAGEEVKCYAQDPIYRPVDRSVLGEEGVVVLEDPRAFLEVDETSVVIAVASDICVRQIVADLARPAVVIWDRVTDEVETGAVTDPVSPRVREMMETEYVELEFPCDRDHFTDVVIYVRKTGLRRHGRN